MILETQSPQTARVAVLGLGYVGCVTAACLAELGHRVCGVDRDAHKVESVLEGKAPFFEPGLEELVARNVTAGRLTAATETHLALRDADVAVVCVGTPSERGGGMSLEQLRRASQEIAACLDERDRRLVVAIRSTVFPGTCEEVVLPALGGAEKVSVVSNPEFLREGCAVKDFLEPSLVVVGGEDPEARAFVAGLYVKLGVRPCLVTLRTAEMIKYASNAYHAVKIGFANEIGALCGQLGIPAWEVMDTLCQDTRLNISPAYLKPGFAFGGSCLPKDLRALTHRSVRMDLELPLLEAVLPSNDRHLARSIQAVLDLPAEKIGVFGLAFKENTDDLRESPVIRMLEQLIGKGRHLRVFDPHVQLDKIYGSNRDYLLSVIPHIGRLLAGSLDEMLDWADHIVVTQKPPADMAARLRACGKPLLDVAGVLSRCEKTPGRSVKGDYTG